MNTQHLDALEFRLSNERARLHAAKSKPEIEARKNWVAQIEKEIASERAFLGLREVVAVDISDDDLLKELDGVDSFNYS